MSHASDVLLFPDAGPLITLAYANALDLLLKPGWTLAMVDMVLLEVTRNQTPTSDTIKRWIDHRRVSIRRTRICEQHLNDLKRSAQPSKSNLGELASQEIMNDLALLRPPQPCVFLFEDHKIARASFLLPDHCTKVSMRAFLIYLEEQGWIDSAVRIESQAINVGRTFSSLRFPPA